MDAGEKRKRRDRAQDRMARLAAHLRENLKRRKAQARSRAAAAPEPAGDDDTGGQGGQGQEGR